MTGLATVGGLALILLGAAPAASPPSGFSITPVAYVLGAALAAACGGGLVAWRRLAVLGKAERGKLEAESKRIIEQAEDTATKSSLAALSAAMEAASREREYLRQELERTRGALQTRDSKIQELEGRLDERDKRINQMFQRIIDLEDQLAKIAGEPPSHPQESA